MEEGEGITPLWKFQLNLFVIIQEPYSEFGFSYIYQKYMKNHHVSLAT